MSTSATAICDALEFLGEHCVTRTSNTVCESLIHTPCSLQLEGCCLPRRLYEVFIWLVHGVTYLGNGMDVKLLVEGAACLNREPRKFSSLEMFLFLFILQYLMQ